MAWAEQQLLLVLNSAGKYSRPAVTIRPVGQSFTPSDADRGLVFMSSQLKWVFPLVEPSACCPSPVELQPPPGHWGCTPLPTDASSWPSAPCRWSPLPPAARRNTAAGRPPSATAPPACGLVSVNLTCWIDGNWLRRVGKWRVVFWLEILEDCSAIK